ncbi:20278_t:CDS:2, partial [Racocetra persica]
QQLKAARANKHAKHANYENLDDYIWSDNNIDERSSDYFAVLLTAGKNINDWKPLGRTIYVGGSKRTQRRKKVELKKAAQNTRPITAYLPSALTSSNVASASTSTFGLSTELYMPTEVESIGSESMEVESIEVELVESMKVELVESMEAELVESMETELVESMETELVKSLKAELVESMKVKLVEPIADASAEIDEKTTMRLAIEELDGYYHDQTKIRASTTIASSLGWGDYKARCIYNHGKFTKVSSLLDDERISMKIMSYLRSHKFSVNPKVLKQYVENEVFPSLGWECKEWKKDIYVDGHKREDVVQYRQIVFLLMMEELDPVLLEYDDQDLTKLVEKSIPPEKKKHCIITHDETTLAANNDKKTGWGPK